jgi:hypothetical protein
MAAQTVRQGTADCLHPCRGLSGLSHGPSVKANRTTRTDPRKTDRPRRSGGPSAKTGRTVRQDRADLPRGLLKLGPSANRLQRKPKAKPDRKQSAQEHDEHAKNTRRIAPARTVRQHHADCPRRTDRAENCSTPRVNSLDPSPDLPNGRSC